MPDCLVRNRNVLFRARCLEDAIAGRVLDNFSEPHMAIEFTQSGRLTFQVLVTAFIFQRATARDSADVTRAAMLGACPWHLAMLAAGLILVGFGFGEHCGSQPSRDKVLRIAECLVVLACDLLFVLLAQWQIWLGDAAEDFNTQVHAEGVQEGLRAQAFAHGDFSVVTGSSRSAGQEGCQVTMAAPSAHFLPLT